MKTLILASSSRYKRQQLETLQLQFTAQAPHIDESAHKGENALSLAKRLSGEKAQAIAPQNPNALIVGCDQSACINGLLLGKPCTVEKAIKQLTMCSGNVVHFYSGVALLDTQRNILNTHVTETQVTFRTLANAEIRNYIKKENALDCAGSFKCESLGISLFECITSDDPSALVGLPLIALNHLLIKAGCNPLLTD